MKKSVYEEACRKAEEMFEKAHIILSRKKKSGWKWRILA